MRNTSIQETVPGSQAALNRIAALLPDSWVLHQRPFDPFVADGGVDAIVDLTSSGGDRVSYVVEAKRSGVVAAPYLLPALRELKQRSSLPMLFVSDYIGPSVRAALTDEGISFADGTGWVRVTSEDPLVLLTGQGAARSPRPTRASAVDRLNGLAANRTLRLLTSTGLPSGVRELAVLAGVSPGSVSKLLTTLAAEGIVDRDDRGRVVTVRRRALIQRWARDYSFPKTNRLTGYYIAPRGLDRSLSRLNDAPAPIAVTGSAAARRLLPVGTTPVVPLRLLALYAARPGDLARELALIEADRASANVVIAAPQDPQILAAVDKGPVLAPVALVLVDLLSLPNRSDAEAEQLMDVLAREDTAWKD